MFNVNVEDLIGELKGIITNNSLLMDQILNKKPHLLVEQWGYYFFNWISLV
jgi:hypothetical protein